MAAIGITKEQAIANLARGSSLEVQIADLQEQALVKVRAKAVWTLRLGNGGVAHRMDNGDWFLEGRGYFDEDTPFAKQCEQIYNSQK